MTVLAHHVGLLEGLALAGPPLMVLAAAATVALIARRRQRDVEQGNGLRR